MTDSQDKLRPDTEHQVKAGFWFWAALGVTVAWVAGVGLAPFWLSDILAAFKYPPGAGGKFSHNMSANEWGDYLTGFLTPPALAWFVGTLYLQNRDLRETIRIADKQAKQLENTAMANKDANEIAAKDIFLSSAELYERAMMDSLRDAIKNLPEIYQYADPVSGAQRSDRLYAHGALDRQDPSLSTLREVLLRVGHLGHKHIVPEAPLERYYHIYREYQRRAISTDSEVLIHSPFTEIKDALEEHYFQAPAQPE